MPAAIPFPDWISPEIIPGLWLRWYGLMYIVAFAITYFLFRWQVKRRELDYSDDDVIGFFLAALLGLIAGARLFGTLVYHFNEYITQPWMVVWPFDDQWNFKGWEGMSFHGGLLGVVVGTLIYAKRKKLKYLEWADMVAIAAPLGYTFGRLGNFINGELWGRVTASPIGMIFPNAEQYSADQPWVRDIATRAGMSLENVVGTINLPRHPSQLYEAFFEGIVLWLVMWFIVRKAKTFRGFATAAYLGGYGLVRFVIEYFREPDKGLYGLFFGPDKNPALFTSVLNFSMGQLFCLFMMVGAVALMFVFKRRAEREAEMGSAPGPKSARKLRKQALNSAKK